MRAVSGAVAAADLGCAILFITVAFNSEVVVSMSQLRLLPQFGDRWRLLLTCFLGGTVLLRAWYNAHRHRNTIS